MVLPDFPCGLQDQEQIQDYIFWCKTKSKNNYTRPILKLPTQDQDEDEDYPYRTKTNTGPILVPALHLLITNMHKYQLKDVYNK